MSNYVTFFFEWTDPRCFYSSPFWEKTWSQIETLFSSTIYELVQYAFANWLFQKNHSQNISMFFDNLSPWKWLECFSKMSVLEKVKSQFEQLFDSFFEWTDSRCSYNSLFSEKAWSQIEILFNFLYMNCSFLNSHRTTRALLKYETPLISEKNNRQGFLERTQYGSVAEDITFSHRSGQKIVKFLFCWQIDQSFTVQM